jgi:hypothetical protein
LKLRDAGYPSASKLIGEIVNSPNQADKYISAVAKPVIINKMTGEQALSALVEAKLTTHQYNVIRSMDPQRFPSFKVVQQAKQGCYPCKEAMTISETSAEVKLQALLDHTAKRLISVQHDVITSLNYGQIMNLCLILKWGFDGSSGHSSYKQKFISADADDSSVFITSIVPLRLTTEDPQKHSPVIWQNPRPSSPRFCRPLRICFAKESTNVSVSEKNRIDEEIKGLHKTIIQMDDGSIINVSYKLCFTVVDGKVCNTLTDTNSTQRCATQRCATQRCATQRYPCQYLGLITEHRHPGHHRSLCRPSRRFSAQKGGRQESSIWCS